MIRLEFDYQLTEKGFDVIQPDGKVMKYTCFTRVWENIKLRTKKYYYKGIYKSSGKIILEIDDE